MTNEELFNLAETTLNEEYDNNVGLCTTCGAAHYQVEPDARNYPCGNCDTNTVSGCEEILISTFFCTPSSNDQD